MKYAISFILATLIALSTFAAVGPPIGGGGSTTVTGSFVALPGNGILISTNGTTNTFRADTNTLATRAWVSNNTAGTNFAQIGIGAAPTESSNAVRLADLSSASNALRRAGLTLYASFTGPNGTGASAVSNAAVEVGRFLHASSVGGVAPNTTQPVITNNSLSCLVVTNGGSVYLAFASASASNIRSAGIRFRHKQLPNDADNSVLVGLHVTDGQYVASGNLSAHTGLIPFSGTFGMDAHTNGYGTFAENSVQWTNVSGLVNQLFNERRRLENVLEYSFDGTNFSGHINGWRFSRALTNSYVFTNQTNLIIQFYDLLGASTNGRLPEIMEVWASDVPNPAETHNGKFVENTGGTSYDMTIRGNPTNAATIGGTGLNGFTNFSFGHLTNLTLSSGARFSEAAGSEARINLPAGGMAWVDSANQFYIARIFNNGAWRFERDGTNAGNVTVASNLTAGGITLAPGGTLNLDGDRIVGALTNAATNFGGVYTNVASLQFTNGNGSVLTISTAFTNTGPSALLGGGTFSGVFSGAGLSTLTNMTSGSFSNGITVGGTAGMYSGTAFRQVVFNTSGAAVSSGSAGSYINVYQPANGGIEINGAGVVTRVTGGGGLNVVGNLTNSGSGTFTNGVISARTNTWTTSELADGQYADWWSNRTAWYRSFRNGASVSNGLISIAIP